MGLDDKIKNKAQESTGKAKEWVGDKTDNERLEAEGAEDRTKANMRQAGEHVKDTVQDATDAFKR
ncbi:MAG TPA: CsbD family protein [Micromonosporaceae bacterium]